MTGAAENARHAVQDSCVVDRSETAHVRGTTGDMVGGDWTRQVEAEQREYAAALAAWLRQAVRHVMRASDPVYASMQHESFETPPDEVVQPTGDDPMTASPILAEASGTVEVSGVVNGDLDDVHAIVGTIADQMLAQLMQAIFAHISEVTERMGNTVKANDDLIETYIQAIETMDIRFDDDGNPEIQFVGPPQVTERFREQFAAMSPEQARRLDQVLTAKREEFNATRRRRRLPRHGH